MKCLSRLFDNIWQANEIVIFTKHDAELRAAHNAYRRLVKERSRITNLIKGLLDALFPEFTHIFKDPCRLTALSVLSACSIPSVIARMTEDEFVATIEGIHQGRLM